MRSNNENKGIQIQSVARAMDIINCFRSEAELGIADISDRLFLNRSTVYGIVNTLASYGILEQDEETKKYRLGIELYEFGELARSRVNILKEVKKYCKPLLAKYPANIHVATYSGNSVFFIEEFSREDAIFNTVSVGRKAPMYCTGVGKAILSCLPISYIDQYFKFPLKKITEHTITERDQLLSELERIRALGYAMDRNEIEIGVSCIAAPVLRKGGHPELAISLFFTNDRVSMIDIEEAAADLKRCTQGISARLGYHKL